MATIVPMEQDMNVQQPPGAPFLSLAVLAYNETKTIERAAQLCSQALEAGDYTYELVLVDDGSTDGTRDQMIACSETLPNCRTIFHPKNLGIGAGIRTCYFGTTGQWATWLPADLQVDPAELPRMIEMLNNCDVLVTRRGPRENLRRAMISVIDRTMVRCLFGLNVPEIHWIKFFRRSVLDRMQLQSRSPTVDSEMLICARKAGARFSHTLLDEKPRECGQATGASLKNLINSTCDLLNLRFKGARLVDDGPATLPAHTDPFWTTDT